MIIFPGIQEAKVKCNCSDDFALSRGVYNIEENFLFLTENVFYLVKQNWLTNRCLKLKVLHDRSDFQVSSLVIRKKKNNNITTMLNCYSKD